MIDPEALKTIKNAATDMIAVDAEKDSNNQDSMDAYLMDWNDAPSDEGIKLTISPTARNAVVGAARLLASTEPIPTVRNAEDLINNGGADKLESALVQMWKVSGDIAGSLIHMDAALSALLFAEVHIAVEAARRVKLPSAWLKGCLSAPRYGFAV
jgi:hypothetical protein